MERLAAALTTEERDLLLHLTKENIAELEQRGIICTVSFINVRGEKFPAVYLSDEDGDASVVISPPATSNTQEAQHE